MRAIGLRSLLEWVVCEQLEDFSRINSESTSPDPAENRRSAHGAFELIFGEEMRLLDNGSTIGVKVMSFKKKQISLRGSLRSRWLGKSQ